MPGLSPVCRKLLHALSKALVSDSELRTLDFAPFRSQSRMTAHIIDATPGKVLRNTGERFKSEGEDL